MFQVSEYFMDGASTRQQHTIIEFHRDLRDEEEKPDATHATDGVKQI